MEYPELSKLFHMDTSSDRYSKNETEAARRKEMDSTFIVEMLSDSEDLFIATPREMSVLIEKILRAERKTSAMMRSIPPIGQAALTRGLVLDEVVSTNTIEGIHSTRRQIEEALESREADDTSFKRFKELALLYLRLAEKNRPSAPGTLEEIREIYDAIMEGELKESDKPDGELFRKGGVDITSNGVKTIHHGVEPESRIFEGLNNMLRLTARNDVPELISSLASHYLFECIHPFYDGNGRTGRYLLALYLDESLSIPTVLSLSRTIAENKNAYYAAFSSVENPLNHGEMTHFIYAMLELIRTAQSSMIERLQSNIEHFETVQKNCMEYFEQNSLSKKEREIVFVLAQYDLFGMVSSLTWNSIADIIELGKQTTRNHLKKLENKGIVQAVSKKPLKFKLTQEAEEALGI